MDSAHSARHMTGPDPRPWMYGPDGTADDDGDSVLDTGSAPVAPAPLTHHRAAPAPHVLELLERWQRTADETAAGHWTGQRLHYAGAAAQLHLALVMDGLVDW